MVGRGLSAEPKRYARMLWKFELVNSITHSASQLAGKHRTMLALIKFYLGAGGNRLHGHDESLLCILLALMNDCLHERW